MFRSVLGYYLYSILLTASHCDSAWAVGTTVFIGATDIFGSDAVEVRFVSQIVKHPDFFLQEFPRNFRLENDVMLVKLSARSNEPLATWATDASKPSGGEALQILGFGQTNGNNPNSLSAVLLKAQVAAITAGICLGFYGSPLFQANIMACAGTASTATCGGDSGSPIFDVATGEIVGLVSYGASDCSEPGVMVRVAAFDDWIQTNICNLSREAADFCPPAVCGDGSCSAGETGATCPEDCPCEELVDSDLEANTGQSKVYSIPMDRGEVLTCTTFGISGDADLILRVSSSFRR